MRKNGKNGKACNVELSKGFNQLLGKEKFYETNRFK